MAKLATSLTDRLKGIRVYPVGVSADDVLRLSVTPDLVEDILKCLASDDIVDQTMGLFFADILIGPENIGGEQRRSLIEQIVWLSTAAKQTQALSYRLLTRFKSEIPEYRAMMLNGLQSADSMVRKEALLAYGCYHRPKELAPLEGV